MDEVKLKIQRAIANIREFKKDAGTHRAIAETYDDGRADAYMTVLGWIEDEEVAERSN